jgi:hypothetical protein
MRAAIGNRQSAIGFGQGGNIDPVTQGFAGVARSDDAGRTSVFFDQIVSKGRAFRANFSDPSCGRFGSSEHSRGLRSRKPRQLLAIFACRSGIFERTGNAYRVGAARWVVPNREIPTTDPSVRFGGKNVARANPIGSGALTDCRLPIADCRFSLNFRALSHV